MVLLWEVTEEFLFYVPYQMQGDLDPAFLIPNPPQKAARWAIPSPDLARVPPPTPGSLEALASRTDLEPSLGKTQPGKAPLLLCWPGHFQVHHGNIGMVGGTGRRDSDITSRLPRKYPCPCGPGPHSPSKDGGRQVISTRGILPQQEYGLRSLLVPLGLVPS